MGTIQQVLVLVNRLADVFCMEEFSCERVEDCPKEECGIELKEGCFRWGYRVSED